MTVEILSVSNMYAPSLERLEREFTVHRLWAAPDRDKLLAEVAPRIRGVQTSGFTGLSAQVIDALPKLEIVASFGVGVDAVDFDATRRRGIVVTNTPDVLNDCVADLALGLMIAAARRIPQGDAFTRAGKWLQGNMPLAMRVTGARLGILGLGRIGRAIAKRAAGFDMQVAYHSRRPVADVPYRYYDKLVDLARDSDFLVVIAPGGKETFHIVDEAVMRALGTKGVLVNVARGSLVDEQALLRVLQEGALGGAALDVFEDEPRVPEAFFTLDNVVLSPHVGSGTHHTRKAMGDLTVDNLIAYFSGKPVLTPVP